MTKEDVYKQLDRADQSNNRRDDLARLQVLLLADILEELRKGKTATVEIAPSSPEAPEVIRANKIKPKITVEEGKRRK
jgi:hypothetical protein